MIVTLRTLTRKSIIGFGKYTDLRVGDLIDTNRKAELVNIYFNLERISYCTDVLDELNIPESLRIEKPGKCHENISYYWDFVKTYELNTMSSKERGLQAAIQIGIRKSVNKGKASAFKATDGLFFSKGKMRNRNQNKY